MGYMAYRNDMGVDKEKIHDKWKWDKQSVEIT